jgi:hypothetical protein
MTHDPLCVKLYTQVIPIPAERCVACSVIIKVREDVLVKCIAAVAACESTSWHRRYEGPWKYRIERDDALAALRALQQVDTPGAKVIEHINLNQEKP